jgi:hypothetical protein
MAPAPGRCPTLASRTGGQAHPAKGPHNEIALWLTGVNPKWRVARSTSRCSVGAAAARASARGRTPVLAGVAARLVRR